MAQRILLQTTLLPTDTDNWTISRFSLLQTYLKSLKDSTGQPLVHLTARDRTPDHRGDDPVLSQLHRADFDQLWLFALDTGDGLSPADCQGITQFHQQGGGILSTRDHQDMGLSMCALTAIGGFHHFHSRQPDPLGSQRDDTHNPHIDWPNYHSGANGDYQRITPVPPTHPLLQHPDSALGQVEYFPAHPHEGSVGVRPGTAHGRVIATGTSQITGRQFNLVVAAERVQDDSGAWLGRVIAQSTFHHFVDYNWDPSMGCPSFVTDVPGQAVIEHPQRLEDTYTYIKNVVMWLAPQQKNGE